MWEETTFFLKYNPHVQNPSSQATVEIAGMELIVEHWESRRQARKFTLLFTHKD